MTPDQWDQLRAEIWPDVQRLSHYGDATQNYEPLCRILDDLNDVLRERGGVAMDLSDLAYYRAYTTPRTPTRH